MALSPDHCIALEDTENGLGAATAAGLATVITTHFFTRHHHFPTAALVVDSLGEPERPFKLIEGDPNGYEMVDIALLDYLLEQAAATDETWLPEVTAAVAG
jgi:hypothetical protein